MQALRVAVVGHSISGNAVLHHEHLTELFLMSSTCGRYLRSHAVHAPLCIDNVQVAAGSRNVIAPRDTFLNETTYLVMHDWVIHDTRKSFSVSSESSSLGAASFHGMGNEKERKKTQWIVSQYLQPHGPPQFDHESST